MKRLRHAAALLALTASCASFAVNADFVDWSRPLESGDRVVFIPPVAGG